MSPLKLLLSIIIITLLAQVYLLSRSSHTSAEQPEYLTELKQAISISSLKIKSIDQGNVQNETHLVIDNTETTKIILSSSQNPFWQIASLQQIFQKATINHQQVLLINLANNHPYATFQNN